MNFNNSDFSLKPATIWDKDIIWQMLQKAINRRKNDGSNQWQDGYPNEETILNDIQNKTGFVLIKNNEITAYVAIIFDLEPAYETDEVNWLTAGKYAVIHRAAVSEKMIGQGIATELFLQIENYVKNNGIFSIKVDTNFDNIPMLKIFEKLDYRYCGEVYFRGSARKAFEKVLD